MGCYENSNKQQQQHLFITQCLHAGWAIVMGHCYGILLCDIVMGYCCGFRVPVVEQPKINNFFNA